MSRTVPAVFRSLRGHNYRVWFAGALLSNIGTWMQRTAQDWLVLTELTHNRASAVGLVMALQFGPQLLLLPLTGLAADVFNQRKLLMITQGLMGALALALGVLTVTHAVQLWQVYIFAFLFGCASAFDAPARQTFVGELVGDEDLVNAVALNSTSFNAARMAGPAIAGIAIASIGTGWAFIVNGVSFVAVLFSLSALRVSELHEKPRARRTRGSLTEGFVYAWKRPDLRTTLIMLLLIGTFGLNFPIFISTMAVRVFHTDAGGYGLLSSVMAVGTMSGALLGAGRDKPRFKYLLIGAALFGVGCALAAIAPSYWLFAGALVIIGVAGADVHEHQQQPDAAVDGARHARASDGDPAGHRTWRDSDWGADRGLDRRPLWAALVNRAGGCGGVERRPHRHLRAATAAGSDRGSYDEPRGPA